MVSPAAKSFQLILNPTRDWNYKVVGYTAEHAPFQLILNPTRDWNKEYLEAREKADKVPINLKPY